MSESLFYQCCRLTPETLFKKGLWHRCFPLNFVKFLRTPFFIEHLWWLLLTISYLMSHRSSRPEVLCERDVLENFTKFAGKHLCFFFNKVAGLALSGVISNNWFPFSNFAFIICQQSRLKKQNIL